MSLSFKDILPLAYPQIEDIVTRIQDEKAGGVAIRTVKSFLSKIPSVVSGQYVCVHVAMKMCDCTFTYAANHCVQVGLVRFWTTQNQYSKYAFLGSFNLLLLQLEADDIFADKTSATDEIHYAYALNSFMCLCMCVLVYEMSHQWRVTPSLPEAVSESLFHMGPPGLAVSQSLSSASTDHKDWAKHCAVQEWKKKTNLLK